MQDYPPPPSNIQTERFQPAQLVVMAVFGLVWLVCNYVWVQASLEFLYLHNDSVGYINHARDYAKLLSGPNWWTFDISAEFFPPMLSLWTLPWYYIMPEEWQALFAAQASIIIAFGGLVAWLACLLYGAKAACVSFLLFLSAFLVETSVRNFMSDGLLGLWITACFGAYVLACRQRFSVASCSMWAACLYAGCLTKWSMLPLWYGFFLMYVLLRLAGGYALSFSPLYRGWLLALREIALWVVIGIAVLALELALDLRNIAVLGVSVAMVAGAAPYLRHTFPLRRFLVIMGAAMVAFGALVYRALGSTGLQQYVQGNTYHNGSLWQHIGENGGKLSAQCVLWLVDCALLPCLFLSLAFCVAYSCLQWRKYGFNLEMVALIALPGLVINTFFCVILVSRYFLAVLGLACVIIGSVSRCVPRWLTGGVLGWCLFSKLFFLLGWMVCPDLPQAHPDYIVCDSMRVRRDNAGNFELPGAQIERLLHGKTRWSSSLLCTGYPACFPKLRNLYAIWDSEARGLDYKQLPVFFVAYGFRYNYCAIDQLGEMAKRDDVQRCSHI